MLAEALKQLDADELVAFHAHLAHATARGYTEKVSALAAILDARGSDDSFEDFVAWLVSQGRRFYETALKTPDALADEVLDVDCGYDGLLGPLFSAFQARTGADGSAVLERRPAVEFAFPATDERELPEWDEAALRQLLPRLFAKRR
jgi:hypothetical protein